MLAGLFTTKITAKYLGTYGAADLGMYYNANFILTVISVACLQTALIRGIASNKENPIQTTLYIESAFGIFTRVATVIAILLIFFHRWISLKLFGTYSYSTIFLLNGIFYLFINANVLFNTILNATGRIKELTLVNIIGSLLLLILTIVLAISYRLYGVLLAVIVTQFILFIIYSILLKKEVWFNRRLYFSKMDPTLLKEFLKFALATLFTILAYLNQMVIRDYIQDHLSKHDAGLWSAMTKLTDYYMTFISSVLTVYFLPKLSEYKENEPMLIRELRKGYKRIIPLVIVFSASIYLARNLIIKLLLTPEFNNMQYLFFFQMSGNIFKISGLLILYLLPVFALNKLNILFIVLVEAITLGTHIILINKYGLIGSSYAYALSMLFYIIFGIAFFHKVIYKIIEPILTYK